MLSKNKQFSNFSHAKQTTSDCFRPDDEQDVASLFTYSSNKRLLARGNGSSYGDCCLNDHGVIIDTSRLNHLLSFDENSGLLVCQSSVTFADLLQVHPHYIPPVIPGTLRATVAGGIANDVHGKNNHYAGSFGEHVEWIDLQLGNHAFHCDRKTHAELFHATIAGLGLTGIIKQAAITMRKASHFVAVRYEKHAEFATLLQQMRSEGCQFNYQVAWLDLLNEPRALLSLANHCEAPHLSSSQHDFSIPKLPIRLINPWVMKQFNRLYFKFHPITPRILGLAQFNNPLDSIAHWNRLYGKKGLLQFQAVINEDITLDALNALLKIIHDHRATPTLAVLKYFTKRGIGLLSFAQPGFTLAIDFINNPQAQAAVSAMNAWVTKAQGKVYLAKDLLLTKEQFIQQYPYHAQFSQLLTEYQSTMRSDLSHRLGITR
ncbi:MULTISPECIES: FAD-binding oxidoreductase [Legionella]|uniref:L-gululonolactone oxidase n=1 Tax=Legionella maceachernii TaxID=466 RepID=A0A0W0W0L4_9GAMM|nr:FAD-binding oxidoreductase [Legionella maceachernii]KTD25931.1 L-gululonolactone oxidase [Legionella maceachernii]SJZ48722.1 FAD/FMN-containing dehydrogenase [Legionella maceachernii]SUP03825.1 Probable decaprenylphosphoryl-beta-D-ribose oxidase [Legionella maceachernii]